MMAALKVDSAGHAAHTSVTQAAASEPPRARAGDPSTAAARPCRVRLRAVLTGVLPLRLYLHKAGEVLLCPPGSHTPWPRAETWSLQQLQQHMESQEGELQEGAVFGRFWGRAKRAVGLVFAASAAGMRAQELALTGNLTQQHAANFEVFAADFLLEPGFRPKLLEVGGWRLVGVGGGDEGTVDV